MVFKNELYPIHFYGRVRGKCDGRLQNWPGINERPKFLAMDFDTHECSTLPTKVEVKMMSRVLKRLASTSPEQTLLCTEGKVS